MTLSPFQLPRGTRSSFNSMQSAGTLATGAQYLITDESRVVLATANNASVNLPISTDLASCTQAITFTGNGDAYIPARVAMTIAQGNAPIGTGSVSYAVSTNAAPTTFNSATLPVNVPAGAWLKVSSAGVSGFLAVHLYRTA